MNTNLEGSTVHWPGWGGLTAGLLASTLGIIGCENVPERAWGWVPLYLVAALLFSPASVGLLWVVRGHGRWRLVTSARNLSQEHRAFFFALSSVLVCEAVAFSIVAIVWGALR